MTKTTRPKIPIAVYDSFGEINGARLFVSHFNELPQERLYTHIDLEQLKQVLVLHEKFEINGAERKKVKPDQEKMADIGSAFFVNDYMLLVFVTDRHFGDKQAGRVHFYHSYAADLAEQEELEECIKQCTLKHKAEDKYINLVTTQQGELFTQQFKVKLQPMHLAKYFHERLVQLDTVIQEGLRQEAGKSLVLLHGDPGTGKTTYVRHLISSVDKPFIYLPPNMTGHLADPSLVSLLSEHQDSVLVVEDADNALLTRNGQNNSAVSNLLNLTDGLLADCFNLKVICTINTSLAQIDPALLRKGRLLAQYEFGLLEPEKANRLLAENNDSRRTSEPMSLAEVFNQDDHRAILEKRVVGFKN